ncbi:Oxysterol-binding protein-related protein 11 [Exaiptasia diaphana]|nr:Oxysterol-binding protein-related protein 11 [Exaiptasia diaphana]
MVISNMASETVIHDPSGDIDLTIYTEEERTAILSVLEKAKNFQQQEENLFRKPMEGQLSKWTNYVRGWQYRWFTLDPDTGMLDYYMEKEKIKQGPRGSVNLAGAVVSPSDEDSFTFSVNAVNGDVFKLRANNPKERQHWINSLRSVAQYHDHNMAEMDPENEETVFPLDEHVLVLKATSQSTLNSLHHCFSILQRRVAEVQNEETSTAITLQPQDQQNSSDSEAEL